MKFLSFILVLSAILSSCVIPHDCKETVTCYVTPLDATFFGFRKDEIDTIVVNARRASEPSSTPVSSWNFNETTLVSMAKSLHANDSFVAYRVNGTSGNDTFYTPIFPVFFIEKPDEALAYEIILPGIKIYILDSIKLTGTATEVIVGSCSDAASCARHLKSYRINGKTYTADNPNFKWLQFEK